jgi:hypothetical protein
MSVPLADRIVQLASSHVGVKEEGGANKGPPVDRFAGGRSEPWCAHFVAWLFRFEGAPLPGDVEPSAVQHNPIASVKTMWRYLQESGVQVLSPKAGDVVVFKTRVDSDRGAGWHVGIVSAVDGVRIQTIEGNSGDSVARRRYLTGDHRILGFARWDP